MASLDLSDSDFSDSDFSDSDFSDTDFSDEDAPGRAVPAAADPGEAKNVSECDALQKKYRIRPGIRDLRVSRRDLLTQTELARWTALSCDQKYLAFPVRRARVSKISPVSRAPPQVAKTPNPRLTKRQLRLYTSRMADDDVIQAALFRPDVCIQAVGVSTSWRIIISMFYAYTLLPAVLHSSSRLAYIPNITLYAQGEEAVDDGQTVYNVLPYVDVGRVQRFKDLFDATRRACFPATTCTLGPSTSKTTRDNRLRAMP